MDQFVSYEIQLSTIITLQEMRPHQVGSDDHFAHLPLYCAPALHDKISLIFLFFLFLYSPRLVAEKNKNKGNSNITPFL